MRMVTQDRGSIPEAEKLSLALLHISESLSESRRRVIQTVCTLTEEVVRCGIESETEEERADIDHLAPARRIASTEQRDEFLHMLLEDLGVDDPFAHEHRADQLAGLRPQLTVRGEDTVTQELFPLAVESLALAVVGELASEQCFDVLRVHGEDDASGNAGVNLGRFAILEPSRRLDGGAQKVEVAVGIVGLLAFVDEVESYGGVVSPTDMPCEKDSYHMASGTGSLQPGNQDGRCVQRPGFCETGKPPRTALCTIATPARALCRQGGLQS